MKHPQAFWLVSGLSPSQLRYLVELLRGDFFSSTIREMQPAVDHVFDSEPSLVMDVGMSRGMDVGFYLSKGHRVVAVEADRASAFRAESVLRELHPHAVLTVLNAAITVFSADHGPVPFFFDPGWPEASSTEAHPNGRGFSGKQVEQHSVIQTRCVDLIRTFGIPLYLKVDVEASTEACVASLQGQELNGLPTYISVELEIPWGRDRVSRESWVRLAGRLVALGYHRFKLVRQRPHNPAGAVNHGFGTSGPFGDEAVDWRRGLAWTSVEQMYQELDLIISLRDNEGLLDDVFDLHAALPQSLG